MTKQFPFLQPTKSMVMLRVVVALFLMGHGLARLIVNSLNDFGAFLNSKGFIGGTPIAWGITVFELIGGLLLILGLYVRWISLILIIELIMGIILVHAKNGWFVVGHQSGGMEYSVLLIVCLLVIAAHDPAKSKSPSL
jgi:putative oxidoreductase